MKTEEIIYKSIGTILTPFKDLTGMPIQPAGASGVKGTVVIKRKYIAGLKDLDGFSHIILIYHFHHSKGYSLTVSPFLDKKSRGLFSTRAPKRPNSVGISVVKLLEINDNRLFIENIDVINKTPLLDIKPYVSEFDNVTGEKIGWLSGGVTKSGSKRSDKRFIK